ncbi:hypothetical protein [Mucilaginibacter pallidiroseus]|uniref:hypothetical protein n=1 Tax=Mucilaginibacter pallidiroseus TaxID=2599295 RepID=UPI001647F0E4|nr:hypothetical protein [Mucilaginibacter pallidiroseus]
MATQSNNPDKEDKNLNPQEENDTESLSTERPLSEKDEIKEAEERTNEEIKKDA